MTERQDELQRQRKQRHGRTDPPIGPDPKHSAIHPTTRHHTRTPLEVNPRAVLVPTCRTVVRRQRLILPRCAALRARRHR
jgi:hypothetical protein